MTSATKLENALNALSIEELKFCAIQYKNLVSVNQLIVAEQINNRLIELMPSGEFAKFAEEKLF